MYTLFRKMAKIIFFSLLIATSVLIILYFIVNKQIINTEVQKAKLATKSIIIMKYSQMLDNKFENIIKLYSKKTNTQIEIFPVFKTNENIKILLKKLQHKDYIYNIKNNNLIFYKKVRVEKECIKCHGGEKKDYLTGFKVGETIGVLKVSFPIRKDLNKYNQIFLFIFFILGFSLIITLFAFYKYMDSIRSDIAKILNFFKFKVSKGIYEPLKDNMIYVEFDRLKKEINNAVQSILFYKEAMIKNYFYNDLTQLPNREKLKEELKKEKFGIAIINVNKFREINDYFGQTIGDELIIKISNRLKNIVNVYHINIDEFAFKVPFHSKEENFRFVEKFLNQVEKPYFIGDKEIILTFRAGLSKAERCDKNDEVHDEITTADIALEFAKKRKQKMICFCDIQEELMNYKNNLYMLTILFKAIKNNGIKVYYQPIVDNKTEKIIKYEALVRIKDEKGNIYYPNQFLEIAKRANLYSVITKKVFERALLKFKNRKEMISLNLDLEDFENDEMVSYLKEVIDDFPDKERITIELLESEDISNSPSAKKFIKYLQHKGVKIFIDDFGSGYSNFSYLFNFKIDGLKIDGSLIKNILTDKQSQMIVETMIEFAKKGGMKIIAEYVENKDIYEMIKNMGIDCSQGYYFGKPQEDI